MSVVAPRVIVVSGPLDFWDNRCPILVDPSDVDVMIAEGWNVRPQLGGSYYVPVHLSRTPRMREKNTEMMILVITRQIMHLTLVPQHWEVGDRKGVKAYLGDVEIHPKLRYVEES